MTDDRARRRVLMGLALSLLLNVFLLGFVAARIGIAPRPRRDGREMQTAMRPGPPLNHPMREMLAGHREGLRESRQQVRIARRGVRDALIAEPFDVERLKQALATMRTATGQAQLALHKALVEAAPRLTPQERAALSRAHRLWGGRATRGRPARRDRPAPMP